MNFNINSVTMRSHEDYMDIALDLAQSAAALGEVPVGALVVDESGSIIGRGFNQPIANHDPTSHAEINAIRDAAIRVGNYRLPGVTLYVTIEPCCMCFGALIHARIARLVYGSNEPRAGAVSSGVLSRLTECGCFNHSFDIVSGVAEAQARLLMKDFFAERRR